MRSTHNSRNPPVTGSFNSPANRGKDGIRHRISGKTGTRCDERTRRVPLRNQDHRKVRDFGRTIPLAPPHPSLISFFHQIPPPPRSTGLCAANPHTSRSENPMTLISRADPFMGQSRHRPRSQPLGGAGSGGRIAKATGR
jgi:hypothetical protein